MIPVELLPECVLDKDYVLRTFAPQNGLHIHEWRDCPIRMQLRIVADMVYHISDGFIKLSDNYVATTKPSLVLERLNLTMYPRNALDITRTEKAYAYYHNFKTTDNVGLIIYNDPTESGCVVVCPSYIDYNTYRLETPRLMSR